MRVGDRVKQQGDDRIWKVTMIWFRGQQVQWHGDPEGVILELCGWHDEKRCIAINPRKYPLVPAE